MKQLERLATIWLLGQIIRDGIATLLVIGAAIVALAAGAVLWRDVCYLVGR